MQCYKNAQPIQQVDVLDRAFHYGDGCFSTARICHNQIELSDRHFARLEQANTQLMLQADLQLIDQSLEQLKHEHEALNGTLKMILSRGVGQRGYRLPTQPADVWVFYYPQALKAHQPELIISGLLQQQIGLVMPALVGLKTLNRLEQVMLKQEADQQHWIEALVSDVQGRIVEGVSSNCFLKINNRWITPELRYNGVAGVMRAEILARMQQLGIACEVRTIHTDELTQLQSLFFCNALSPMKIVSEFSGHTLDTQACMQLFQQLQLDQMSSYVSSEI